MPSPAIWSVLLVSVDQDLGNLVPAELVWRLLPVLEHLAEARLRGQKAGLGLPLPAGRVRVYKLDPAAYDAALVILDAIKRVAASGKEVNRANVRDAIQESKVKTLQGEVSFDQNGDITWPETTR